VGVGRGLLLSLLATCLGMEIMRVGIGLGVGVLVPPPFIGRKADTQQIMRKAKKARIIRSGLESFFIMHARIPNCILALDLNTKITTTCQ